MCAVLGLWIVHVILGFNQNWLEMPLMLCHTAARGFIVGGQWEEHHSLPGVNTACLPDVVRYFHLKFMSFVLVPVGSLCEMEAVFAWVHVWWIVWRGEIRSFWNQLFLEPRGTAYGKGRDCVTLHPHWRFAHGCDCSSPSANRVWWAPFVGYPGFFSWRESFQSTTRWQCTCSAAGNKGAKPLLKGKSVHFTPRDRLWTP